MFTIATRSFSSSTKKSSVIQHPAQFIGLSLPHLTAQVVTDNPDTVFKKPILTVASTGLSVLLFTPGTCLSTERLVDYGLTSQALLSKKHHTPFIQRVVNHAAISYEQRTLLEQMKHQLASLAEVYVITTLPYDLQYYTSKENAWDLEHSPIKTISDSDVSMGRMLNLSQSFYFKYPFDKTHALSEHEKIIYEACCGHNTLFYKPFVLIAHNNQIKYGNWGYAVKALIYKLYQIESSIRPTSPRRPMR